MQPAIAVESPCCFFWILVVSAHYVFATEKDFSNLAGCARFYLCFEAVNEFACCIQLVGFPSAICYERTAFCHTVTYSEAESYLLEEGFYFAVYLCATEDKFDEVTTECFFEGLAYLAVNDATESWYLGHELDCWLFERRLNLALVDLFKNQRNRKYQPWLVFAECLEDYLR